MLKILPTLNVIKSEIGYLKVVSSDHVTHILYYVQPWESHEHLLLRKLERHDMNWFVYKNLSLTLFNSILT